MGGSNRFWRRGSKELNPSTLTDEFVVAGQIKKGSDAGLSGEQGWPWGWVDQLRDASPKLVGADVTTALQYSNFKKRNNTLSHLSGNIVEWFEMHIIIVILFSFAIPFLRKLIVGDQYSRRSAAGSAHALTNFLPYQGPPSKTSHPQMLLINPGQKLCI